MIDNNSNKWLTLENVYFFWVLMISVAANRLTTLSDPRLNPIGFLLTIILTVAIYQRYRIKLSSYWYAILGVLVLWAGVHYFIDADYKLLQYIVLIMMVFIAYITINVFRSDIFSRFHNLVLFLTKIDLLLWGIQNIIGTEIFKALAPFKSTGTSLGSYMIYSVANNNLYEEKGMFGLLRNAGFCWEPGFYASVVVMAIFINLMQSNYQIKGNRALYVLFVGLLSTFSTTGCVAIIVLALLYYLFSSKKLLTANNILSLIIVSICVAFAWSLPFMREKIEKKSDSSHFFTENTYGIDYMEQNEYLNTVDRFEGMSLDLLNIQDKPWLGYGTQNNSYVQQNISSFIVISNGTTQLIAKYGIIIALFLILLLYKNSVYLRKLFPSCQNSWLLVLTALSVSYNFLGFPLFIAISFMKQLMINSRLEIE